MLNKIKKALMKKAFYKNFEMCVDLPLLDEQGSDGLN